MGSTSALFKEFPRQSRCPTGAPESLLGWREPSRNVRLGGVKARAMPVAKSSTTPRRRASGSSSVHLFRPSRRRCAPADMDPRSGHIRVHTGPPLYLRAEAKLSRGIVTWQRAVSSFAQAPVAACGKDQRRRVVWTRSLARSHIGDRRSTLGGGDRIAIAGFCTCSQPVRTKYQLS